MLVHLGSKNATKLAAVQNILTKHDLFPDCKVVAIKVDVEEFGHPKTLADTIDGAKDRAKQAFRGKCDYSIGIESGMYEVTEAKSGYFESTVCAIYDGENFHLGMGPSYEWPKEMVQLILSGKDGSQAIKELGLTDHPKLGEAEGAIHIFSHGKLNRTKLNELALLMALVHIENPDHYR